MLTRPLTRKWLNHVDICGGSVNFVGLSKSSSFSLVTDRLAFSKRLQAFGAKHTTRPFRQFI
jgi:hypothetical protein